jgi:hypothetical protein
VNEYPKVYSQEADMPPRGIALVRELMPRLLSGAHPALAALRAQYASATVSSLEWTGLGFHADFGVAAETPLAEPHEVTGGDARIELDGVPNGAGCLVFVRAGRLSSFEAYCFGDEWAEEAVVLGIRGVVPLFADWSP